MKKSTKIFTIILAVVIVIAAGMWFMGRSFSKRFSNKQIANIERYTVTKGDLTLSSVGSGKITSTDIKTIVPTGNVTEIKVKVGDYVKSGDELAKYTTLTNEIKTLKSDYEGVVTMVPSGAGDLSYGSIPKVSSQVFEISGVSTLQMVIQSTENDIYKIKIDQKASIYIDALNLTVDGVVSRVSQAGNTAGDFTVYDVTVKFDKKDNNIYLGMTGSAKIIIDTKKDALKIPLDALVENNDKRYVVKSEWLNNTNKPQSDYYVEVKTGLADTDFVEITSGNIDNTEILIIPKDTSSSPFRDWLGELEWSD